METVTSEDILQFEMDFKMVTLTEASTVQHGLLKKKKRLLQQQCVVLPQSAC